MNLPEYHKLIVNKLTDGNFTIKQPKDGTVTKDSIKTEMFHFEAIHYLMYEWCVDNRDSRFRDMFSYVCIPDGVNKGNCDIDFSKWTFEEFLINLVKLKI